jgi:hypothetical protein
MKLIHASESIISPFTLGLVGDFFDSALTGRRDRLGVANIRFPPIWIQCTE